MVILHWKVVHKSKGGYKAFCLDVDPELEVEVDVDDLVTLSSSMASASSAASLTVTGFTSEIYRAMDQLSDVAKGLIKQNTGARIRIHPPRKIVLP